MPDKANCGEILSQAVSSAPLDRAGLEGKLQTLPDKVSPHAL